MKKLIVLFIIVILSSCCHKNKEMIDTKDDITFERFIYNQYGKATEIIYNEDKKYAVTYVKMPVAQGNNMPTLNIDVYDVEKKASIYRTSLVKGSIKWISNEELRFTSLPGMVSRDEPINNNYIFNVVTQTRSDLN